MYEREEKRIVNVWGEGKGVGGGEGRRASLEPLFSIAVQYPNWLGQQSDWGPQRNRTAASSRKAEIPLSSSGTRLEQGDERCYRLGNIKSPLFLCLLFRRVRAAN